MVRLSYQPNPGGFAMPMPWIQIFQTWVHQYLSLSLSVNLLSDKKLMKPKRKVHTPSYGLNSLIFQEIKCSKSRLLLPQVPNTITEFQFFFLPNIFLATKRSFRPLIWA